MFTVNFEFLANIKNFKLLTPRQSSYYQLRLSVFSQAITNKKHNTSLAGDNIFTSMNTEQNIGERRNSFNRSSSLQVENNKPPQLSEIDIETNSFLTRPFLLQRVDHFLAINEVVVFKGAMRLSVDEMVAGVQDQEGMNRESIKDGKNVLFNKLLVCCELFLVSSFTTESIGEWRGYTMTDEGNVALPVSFFAYDSSFSQVELMFLWTSLEFTATSNVNDKKLQRVTQFLNNKLLKLSVILSTPITDPLKLSHRSKQNSACMQKLSQTITEYNEQVNLLWKCYQQYQQQIITDSKMLEVANEDYARKSQHYEKSLREYHWRNNIIVTKENVEKNGEEEKDKRISIQLDKLKNDVSVDRNLLFYPFVKHERTINLDTGDLMKLTSVSSLNHPQSSTSKPSQPFHLIIFVHGYQASGYDMQNLACFLKYKQPSLTKTFISTCNQGRTEQPIQESGHRLALEIKNFINNKFEHYNAEYDISFVCHSMGGLIVRAALKYLQLYKKKFRTFLSLCSPHLGYLYHSSALIKTSLWVLNQVKKDASMLQLTMQDNEQLQKTFLFELSKKSQLEWFRYPIFIGSREDEYVPFWSAMLKNKEFYFETKDAKVYKELYKNLGEKLEKKIVRLETVYKDKVNDISSFVGRTAHIRILNCIEVMEIIYLLIEGAV